MMLTLTVRFEQRCEISGPPLRGYVRYDFLDPNQPPPPGDAAAFGWSPPPGAVPDTGDYLYFESSPGDYIGQGRTELYTQADSTLVPDWWGRTFQFFVHEQGTGGSDWRVELAGRYNQPLLQPGLYDDVQRWPDHNPAKGGLAVAGEGRGCNELSGRVCDRRDHLREHRVPEHAGASLDLDAVRPALRGDRPAAVRRAALDGAVSPAATASDVGRAIR